MTRAVVRRIGKTAAAAPDVSAMLADCGISVLDTTDSMILIEGEPAAIAKAAAALDGWQAMEVTRAKRPRPVRPAKPVRR